MRHGRDVGYLAVKIVALCSDSTLRRVKPERVEVNGQAVAVGAYLASQELPLGLLEHGFIPIFHRSD